MKLTYDQKIKLYTRFAQAKKFRDELIIQTLPEEGIWLGHEFYSLKLLIDTLNKNYKTNYEI